MLLLQTDEQEVITFLLTTEIIPLCLRIMESGSELSKTVATFILQKILLDDSGLSYICQTYDRFSHVAMILVSSAQWEIVVTCGLNSYPGHAST
jgi:CCR4-NOT transcription complex subunit 9